MQPNFRLLILLLLIMPGESTRADLSATDEAVNACTQIRSSLERLACFDELFQTPIYPEAFEIPLERQPKYGIVKLFHQHEQGRVSNDYSLRMSQEIEHAVTKQERVLISTPALGAIGARPIFALSCIENITRLQIILPESIAAARVSIELSNEQGRRLLNDRWQVIGGGHIIDAGRGIPSIRSSQRLIGVKRLTISSDESAVDGLTFDLAGLGEKIPTLQEACHWLGGLRANKNPAGDR